MMVAAIGSFLLGLMSLFVFVATGMEAAGYATVVLAFAGLVALVLDMAKPKGR